MAGVSTEAGRKSAVSFLQPWQPVIIPPDGSMTAADRQAVVWTYAGILVTIAALATGILSATFVGKIAEAAFAGKISEAAFTGKISEAAFAGKISEAAFVGKTGNVSFTGG